MRISYQRISFPYSAKGGESVNNNTELKELIVNGTVYNIDTSLIICKDEEVMSIKTLYLSKNKNFFIVEKELSSDKITSVNPVDSEEAMDFANHNTETIDRTNYIAAFGELKEG